MILLLKDTFIFTNKFNENQHISLNAKGTAKRQKTENVLLKSYDCKNNSEN